MNKSNSIEKESNRKFHFKISPQVAQSKRAMEVGIIAFEFVYLNESLASSCIICSNQVGHARRVLEVDLLLAFDFV